MDGSGQDDSAWLRLMEVSSLVCLPMAMKAAINLGVFDILLEQQPPHHRKLTAAQIVTLMEQSTTRTTSTSGSPKQMAVALDRILRVLACHSILTADDDDDNIQEVGRPKSPDVNIARVACTTRYGPTPMCKYLVQGQVASLFLLRTDKVVVDTWHHLHEAVLDGAQPFTLAHGTDSFSYPKADPRFNTLFNSAMASRSKLHIASLLRTYRGFEGVSSVVDIGGGLGVTCSMIVAQYPSIRAINFDLPHVIETAPFCPGVQHMGGDMFVQVPQAEICFMKLILHDWDDECCIKILKSCFEALPLHGKAIIVDNILGNKVDTSLRSRVVYHLDLQMMVINQGGRERTEEEIKALGKAAGFLKAHVVCYCYELGVMELHKF